MEAAIKAGMEAGMEAGDGEVILKTNSPAKMSEAP